MSNTDSYDLDMGEYDEKRTEKLLLQIILEESENLKSTTGNNSQMVDKIKKMIEEEMKCF